MEFLLYPLAAVCAAYILLILIPSATVFFCVFSRHAAPVYDEKAIEERFSPSSRQRAADNLKLYDSAEFEEKYIYAGGLKLCAEYLDRSAGVTVILLHGFRSSPRNCSASCFGFLYGTGFNILMPYQRAHGKSEGKLCSMGMLECGDLLSWIGWVKENTGTEKILLWGVSMGCATVAYASDRLEGTPVRGIVFDCGYDCPKSVMRLTCEEKHLPYALMYPVSRLQGKIIFGKDMSRKTAEALGKASIPALFIHGEKDSTVPAEQGRSNFEAYAGKKLFCSVPEARHAEAFAVLGDRGSETVRSFFPELFGGEQ